MPNQNLKFKKEILALILAIGLCLVLGVAFLEAQTGIPQVINYHGKLKDATGNPLTGTYDFAFRLYGAETRGNLVWGPETHAGVSVTNGYFNVKLGSILPFNLDFTKPYWLSIEVNNDGEMFPRVQLASFGYAFTAQELYRQGADLAIQTIASGNIILKTAGNIQLLGGNVGIGTTTPAFTLDVAGNVQMTGFKMPTGAQAGYVLTSDSTGVGTWQLQSVGLSWPLLAPDGTAEAPSYSFANNSNLGLFRPADNTLAFTANGVERMRIGSTGNIGIGTISPTAKLYLKTEDLITVPFQVENAIAGVGELPLPGWTYRRPITISNEGVPLSDYQLLITLDTASLIADNKMRSDGGDIRFTNSDGTTLLSYWLESGLNTASTRLWVKVPSIPAGTIIYFYYGNTIVTSESNGETTFDFFDDFFAPAIDTTKWNIINPTGFSIVNGMLRGSSTSGRIQTHQTFSSFSMIESRVRVPTLAPNGHMVLGTRLATNNNFGAHVEGLNGHWGISEGVWWPYHKPAITNWALYQVWEYNSTGYIRTIEEATGFTISTSRPNIITNEPITLGKYYDDWPPVQSYVCLWDWIRVRKYADPEPTLDIGDEEAGGQAQITSFYIQPATGNVGIGTTGPARRLSIVDSGVGLDRPAADVLGFYTANTERMRIDSAGNVGIGTTTPAFTLDVAGNVQMTGFKMPTGAQAGYVLTSDSTGVGTWQEIPGVTNAFVQGGNALGALAVLGTNDNFGLAFKTNNVERIRIDIQGRVGIGVVSPQERLTLLPKNNFAIEMAPPENVNAMATIGGNLTPDTPYRYKVVASDGVGTTIASAEAIVWPDPFQDAVLITWDPVPGAISYRVYGRGEWWGPLTQYWITTETSFLDVGNPGTGGSPPAITTAYTTRIAGAGNSWILGDNLGIGIAIPQAKLDVAGTVQMTGFKMPTGAQAGYVLTSDSTGVGTWQLQSVGLSWPLLAPDGTAEAPSYSFANNSNLGLFRPADNTLAFTANGVERMRIGSTGNVGIGTISPTAKLYLKTEDLATVPFQVEGATEAGEFPLPGWSYRRPITITNTGTSLTDYQLLITLDTLTLITAGKMRSNGGDIRFTDSDGLTLIPYWIEAGINTVNTKIWVKVPSIPAGDMMIYIYYGNPDEVAAPPATDGETTFSFFDDFEGTDLDPTKWDYDGYAGYPQIYYSVSDGVLNVWGAAGTLHVLRMIKTFSPIDYIVAEAKFKNSVAGSWHQNFLIQEGNLDRNRFGLVDMWGNAIVDWHVQYRIDDGTWSYSSALSITQLDVWYISAVEKQTSNTLRAVMRGLDYNQLGNDFSHTATGWADETWTWVTMRGAGAADQLDWVRVRKYASSVPTTDIGTEQTGGEQQYKTFFFIQPSTGNIGIGTTNPGGGVGSSVLSIYNTNATPTAVANVSHLFSAGGEGYWMDAAGNITLQTPHDLKTGEWIFSSQNIITGKSLRVDMERLVKDLDKLLGGGYLFEENLFEKGGSLDSQGLIEGEDLNNEEPTEPTEKESFITGFVQKIKQTLSFLGLAIENGIVRVQKLITGFIETESLKVGSPKKPTGITVYDEDTGEPYCLKIKSGQTVSIPGECRSLSSTGDSSGGSDSSGGGVSVPDICDVIHLNLCLTEIDCANAGGYWYNDTCNAELETPAEPEESVCSNERLDLCTTQELCEGVKLYWHNDTCNLEPEVVPIPTD